MNPSVPASQAAASLRASLLLVAFLFLPFSAAAQTPLRFLGDRDYQPLSFLDGGEPRGFDVEVMQAVGRLLGREIRIDLMDWAEAQNVVQRGDADGLIDLTITDQRSVLYDFAQSTVTHDFGLFVRADDETTGSVSGLVGRTVAVTQQGFPREFFQRRPDVRLVIVANYEDGFQRLLAGSVDAVAADVWGGATTVEERGLTGIVLGGEPFASLPAAIAVRKGDTALLEAINGALRSLEADGTLEATRTRWRPREIVFMSRDRMRTYVTGGAALVLGVLLLATTAWALALKRQVRVRRAVESALVESNQRLGLALAAANMGTWRWSAETNLDTRDANLNRMFGLDAVELTQPLDDVFARVHDEDRDAMRATFERAVRDHIGYVKEFRIVRPDGSIRMLRGQGKAFYDDEGKPLYATGVTMDITGEMQALERDRLLTHALQSANDCIVVTDPSGHIIYVNDAFLRTYEYVEPEILGRHIDCVQPEGQVSVLTGAESDGWRGELMNRSKSGRVFPVSLATSLVRDAGGGVAAVVSVARDVTNEKLAEDALRSSEERFFKAFEASPDCIAIVDFGSGGVLVVNEAFERITGYARSAVLGRTLEDLGILVDPHARDVAVERLRQLGAQRDVELQLRRKSGEVVTVLASGGTLELAGKSCFLTVLRDISEQKRFELHLRRAAELNKVLLTEMDLEGLSVAIVESAHKILALDYASLVLRDADSRVLRLKAQRGIINAGRSPGAGQAFAALALKRGSVQTFRRAELETSGAASELLAAGVQGLCALPLTTAQGDVGALIVGSVSSEGFSAHDITLLHQLATYGAIAIQNARSYEEITALKDQVSREKLYLEEEIRVDHNFADIVGESLAIKRVLQQIETVAPTDASVLILGETGTGKELLARALHDLSPRKDRTFVRMNAAALPATLLESELFGYDRGAFTGANVSKVGRMELAHRGTLFLDEVGDIPLEVQPKLLRVLQEREFERLGSTRTQHIDVRLIAATNRDLQQMVDEGTFRSDLFYRLNVFPLQVPPLRDRRDDIPILVRYFVQKFASRLKRRITSIPSHTMTELQDWHWPGNIRELENVIERAVIVSNGDVLQVPAFPQKISLERSSTRLPAFVAAATALSSSTFEDGERDIIINALRETNGVIAGPVGAAARLGIKRTTLQSKMRKLGIRRPSF